MTFIFIKKKGKQYFKLLFKNLNPTLNDNIFTYRWPFITNNCCKGLGTLHILVAT